MFGFLEQGGDGSLTSPVFGFIQQRGTALYRPMCSVLCVTGGDSSLESPVFGFAFNLVWRLREGTVSDTGGWRLNNLTCGVEKQFSGTLVHTKVIHNGYYDDDAE